MRSPKVRVCSKTGGAWMSSGDPRKQPKGLRSRPRGDSKGAKCPGGQRGERLKRAAVVRRD